MFIVTLPFLILFVLLNSFHSIPSLFALGRAPDRIVVKYFFADWGDELGSLLGVWSYVIWLPMERSKSRNLASNADSMIQNGYLFYYVGMIKAAKWVWGLAGAGRITTVLSRPLLDSERSRSSPPLRIRFGSPRIRGSPSDA